MDVAEALAIYEAGFAAGESGCLSTGCPYPTYHRDAKRTVWNRGHRAGWKKRGAIEQMELLMQSFNQPPRTFFPANNPARQKVFEW